MKRQKETLKNMCAKYYELFVLLVFVWFSGEKGNRKEEKKNQKVIQRGNGIGGLK